MKIAQEERLKSAPMQASRGPAPYALLCEDPRFGPAPRRIRIRHLQRQRLQLVGGQRPPLLGPYFVSSLPIPPAGARSSSARFYSSFFLSPIPEGATPTR